MQLTKIYKGRPAALRYTAPGVLPAGAGALVVRNDTNTPQPFTISTNKGSAQFVRGYGMINTSTPLQFAVAALGSVVLALDDITQYLAGTVTVTGTVQVAAIVNTQSIFTGGAFADGVLQSFGILTASEVLQCQ